MFLASNVSSIYCQLPTSPTTRSEVPTSSESVPLEKNAALRVWLATFGIAIWLHVTANLAIRVLFISICTILVSVVDGSLNLLVGHAVLRAVKHDGYDPSLPSSIQAGSFGGFVVIGPTTLAVVSLVALFGTGLKIGPQNGFLLVSRHVAVLLELASAIAVSSAAASVGVVIVRWVHPEELPPLNPVHAARAGALGACIIMTPVVWIAAWLWMCKPRTTSRIESDTPPAPGPGPALTLVDGFGHPLPYTPSNPRARPSPRVITRPVVLETMGYLLITFCILSIRLLCF